MGCIKSKLLQNQRLTKEDLKFLKTHTSYEEQTIKEWFNEFKQECPDGQLTPVHFVNLYRKFFNCNRSYAKQFGEQVFRTFDTDKDGYVDFKVFLLAVDVTSGTAQRDPQEEELKWAFRMEQTDENIPHWYWRHLATWMKWRKSSCKICDKLDRVAAK